MCLFINHTKNSRNKIRTGRRVFFKVVRSAGSSRPLITPFRLKPIRGGYTPIARSSVKITNRELSYGQINKGIHVCTTRAKARKMVDARWNRTYIKVFVFMKDLVSFGDGEDAVFTKVFYPKSELEKAKAQLQKQRKAVFMG